MGSIFAAQARGEILTYIIAPSVVYGLGSGPCCTHSRALQFMTALAMKHGGGLVVNDGTAVWSSIHMDDLVELFIHVFTRALKDSSGPSSPALAPPPKGADLPDSAYEYAIPPLYSNEKNADFIADVSIGLPQPHSAGEISRRR
jgi:hypothetical protein